MYQRYTTEIAAWYQTRDPNMESLPETIGSNAVSKSSKSIK